VISGVEIAHDFPAWDAEFESNINRING